MSEIVVTVRPKRASPFEIPLTRLLEQGASMARLAGRRDVEQAFVEALANLAMVGDDDIGTRES